MADAIQSYAAIWARLSALNVNDHVEEKNGLSYLSWSWAWATLLDHYPDATFEFTKYENKDGVTRDVLYYGDGSASVECTVTIGECKRSCWLPVMDYRNKAIVNPDARSISDTKMRCLVKTLALFGLAHYIYAGEDLPQERKQKSEPTSTTSDDADDVDAKIAETGAALKEAGTTIPKALRARIKSALDSDEQEAKASVLAEMTELLNA